MSQRSTSIIVVFVILLLGIGGFVIATGIFSFFAPVTTPTTTTSTAPTTSTTTTTTTTTTTIPTITTTTTTPTTTTNTTTGEAKTLTILTRNDISIQTIFQEAFLSSDFAIEHNITSIRWRAPTEEFWDDLILAGGIDLCWGGGVSLFNWLAEEGLLSPLESPLMQDVASRVNDTIAGAPTKGNNTLEQLVWIASKISTYGFTVNHDFLDTYSLPVPYYWENLSSPVYGQMGPDIFPIALGNAPDTTSHAMIYNLILQLIGWEDGWIQLTRMAGNSEIYGGSIEAQYQVQNGDAGIVPCIDFYGFLSQFQNPSCEYIVPQDGTIIEGDPIGMAINTAQQELAEGFIDFVLSPYGQSLWLDESLLRLPILREAFDEPSVSGMDYMYTNYNQTVASASFIMNQSQVTFTQMSMISYFQSVLTNSLSELHNCWTKMVQLYYDGNITLQELDSYASQMGEPVTIVDPKTAIDEQFNLEYAIAINNDMTYDGAYHSAVQSRWTTAAKIQYSVVQSNLETLYPVHDSQSTAPWSFIEPLEAILIGMMSTGGFVALALIRPKYY